MEKSSFKSASAPVKGVHPWPATASGDGGAGPSRTEGAADAQQADSAQAAEGADTPRNPEDFSYADLVGFDRAIAEMNKKGIGLSHDESFGDLMEVLRKRHGVASLPSFQTMVFTSFAREDANQFMFATAKELGAPGMRMFMEETPMGFPVLCVMTTSDFKMNMARGGFNGPGTLLLEDIDLWGMPFSNVPDEVEEALPYSYLSRGLREAIMFIRSAVLNPDVNVMATCASAAHLDDFFLDLLDPISFMEIDLPNEEERAAIWRDAVLVYPSLRPLESDELVRLSANLSRYDIYLAAREAVDQAFRDSIEQRKFVPVTRDNLYNKIAAFLPLDSDEYKELEESAVESLRSELDHVENLLKGNE